MLIAIEALVLGLEAALFWTIADGFGPDDLSRSNLSTPERLIFVSPFVVSASICVSGVCLLIKRNWATQGFIRLISASTWILIVLLNFGVLLLALVDGLDDEPLYGLMMAACAITVALLAGWQLASLNPGFQERQGNTSAHTN